MSKKYIKRMMGRRGGLTLVETLVGVVVVAILSTAVTAMVVGSLNTNRYVQAQTTANSEVELAQMRMVYNVRTAGAAPTWSTVNGYQTLSIAKTGVGTILYYVNGSNNLVEDDPRYDSSTGVPNTLVHSVKTNGFSCTVTAPSGTQTNTLVTINLTVATAPVVERHVTAAVRGF